MSRARDTRLLLIDPEALALGEAHVHDLARLLRPGDLMVVNDAATFPASLHVTTEQDERLELRFLEAPYTALTRAVLFGAGDHRTPTEHRPPPPVLSVGDVLSRGAAQWLVAEVSTTSPRLVQLAWPGELAQRFCTLYELGRPVQYSHEPAPLALWDVQTAFAARPFAAEMPSAAHPIEHDTWRALTARGVRIAALSHAAGLSATGDASLDRALPLPEHYEIPRSTAERVRGTLASGQRVIAVGTSVVRALEDAALQHGQVVAGAALARLVIGAHTQLRVVSGLVTGIHVPGESHHRLLEAFAPDHVLARAGALARERGYRPHEFGESCLVLGGVLTARASQAA